MTNKNNCQRELKMAVKHSSNIPLLTSNVSLEAGFHSTIVCVWSKQSTIMAKKKFNFISCAIYRFHKNLRKVDEYGNHTVNCKHLHNKLVHNQCWQPQTGERSGLETQTDQSSFNFVDTDKHSYDVHNFLFYVTQVNLVGGKSDVDTVVEST